MSKDLSQSPLPKKRVGDSKELNFLEAIKAITDGKKVTRLEWDDKEVYGFLNKTILSLHKKDGIDYQWIVNDGDLTGTDWIII